MIKKLSVKTKISIAVLMVSVACSILIGCFSFFSYKNNLQDYMGKRALDIAQTASANISGDKIESYDKTGKTDDSYQAMVNYLSDIKKKVNLTYIYVITDSGDNYKYIAEGYLKGESPSQLGDTQTKADFGEEAANAYSTGKGTYTTSLDYDTTYKVYLLSGYAPVFNSQGTAVGVVGVDISAAIIEKSLYSYLPILLGIMVLFCILSFLLIYYIVSKLVVGPLQVLERTSLKLSDCDFDISIPNAFLIKNDEIGHLSQAFAKVAANMKSITQDISLILTQMADKNLSVEISHEYTGGFSPIKDSINHIIELYNDLLIRFKSIAEQVSSDSRHVSDNAQTLAQGSTEQASAIDELSDLISHVSEEANKNNESVNLAKSYVTDVDHGIKISDEHMKNMLSAMEDIHTSSSRISNIIKVINDIALQTNILALNASIEASRAGTAGKGFAVVADEVRSLAARSADAAKETNELIENSIYAAGKGKDIAQITAQALSDVDTKAQLVSDTINEITIASNEQAAAIREIKQSLNQISIVVQNNSAMAEESAAASEELSGQATILNDEISKFELREEAEAATPEVAPLFE